MKTFKERFYDAWNDDACFEDETFVFQCFMCAFFCARLLCMLIGGAFLVITSPVWIGPYYLWYKRKERKHNA